MATSYHLFVIHTKNVKQESKVLPFLTKSSGMIKSLFFETKENVSKENSEKSI